MDVYRRKVEVRWSDLDPNYHLRHSVYYDWGAYLRLTFLNEHGLTPSVMNQYHFGPILFREECVFKKEITLADKITIDLKLVKAKKDGSRFTMQHQIFKNNEIAAAIITLDAAWIDTVKRKLTLPPAEALQTLELSPKTEGFEWLV